MTTETPLPLSPLAELLSERYGPRPLNHEEVLWAALMRCYGCDHLMLEHDEVAMRCLECRCDESRRGLSAYADDRLMDLGKAMGEVDLAAESA